MSAQAMPDHITRDEIAISIASSDINLVVRFYALSGRSLLPLECKIRMKQVSLSGIVPLFVFVRSEIGLNVSLAVSNARAHIRSDIGNPGSTFRPVSPIIRCFE